MRAAVCTGPGAVEVREWPEPTAGRGEVVVRVRGCGLCGSDIAKVVGGRAPAVLGHEVVGDVAAVGAGVSTLAPGARVVVAHHVPCFACHYCRRGSPSMCRAFKRVNLDPGGFAELVRVPAQNVEHATFLVPAHLSDEAAAFTEPLACCLRAVERSRLEPGDAALVVGLGSVGCLMAQVLAQGGARVLAWDLLAARRRIGRGLGAQVPDSEAELDQALGEATEGRGADAVILTAGGAGALGWAAARARDGGLLNCFAGGPGEALPLALDTLYHRELTVTATYSSSPGDLARAFDLLRQGAVRVDGLVTHRLPLERLAEGIDLARRQQALKVFITP